MAHRATARRADHRHGFVVAEGARAGEHEPFQTARRERAFAIFDRAIAQGELGSALDYETAADVMAALYWRLAVVRGPSGRAYIERLARMTVAAIRAA